MPVYPGKPQEGQPKRKITRIVDTATAIMKPSQKLTPSSRTAPANVPGQTDSELDDRSGPHSEKHVLLTCIRAEVVAVA